jgi:hypothetical protein
VAFRAGVAFFATRVVATFLVLGLDFVDFVFVVSFSNSVCFLVIARSGD